MQVSQCAGAACLVFLLLTMVYSVWTFWRTFDCEMSWMYPQYSLVLRTGPYALYKSYEGYLPGGKVAPSNGYVPALFLPGNAGSYEQVRSLGAETARDFRHRNPPVARDLVWYVADFHEELSAFSGHLMMAQTKFTAECLVYLHKRYAGGPNRKMVLVGHSMGGVIARAAVQKCIEEGSFGPDSISLILTLASPHQHPPFMTQPAMAQFYAKLSPAANTKVAGKDLIVPIVSIDGSPRDWQVHPVLAQLEGVSWTDSPHFTASMSTLPGVWVGADHQCIVWCNQLVIRLASQIVTVVNRKDKKAFDSDGNPLEKQISSSHAHGVIHSFQSELKAVSEAELRPGSYSEFLNNGPICRSPLPDIVASGDLLPGPDVLEVDVSIFQKEEHKSKGVAWAWNWSDMADQSHFSLLVGAEKPCSGFRLWVTINETYIQEVTGLVHSLPPATEAAQVKPLKHNDTTKAKAMSTIMKGRDYFAGATWWLIVGDQQLRHATRVILWISSAAKHTAFFVQGTASTPQAAYSPPLHILGMRHFFITERISSQSRSFKPRSENLKATQRGVKVPLQIGVLDYVASYLHIELAARIDECRKGYHGTWEPLVVDPDPRREARDEYSVYHVLAPPGCSLLIWIRIPIGRVFTEYLIVKSGELLALCLCFCVWKLLRLNEPSLGIKASVSQKQANFSRLYEFLVLKLGVIGLFWLLLVGFVSLGARGASGLLARWPVHALGMWMQPFETRYPAIYAVWDSCLAVGLIQLFKWMLEASAKLCLAVQSLAVCTKKVIVARFWPRDGAELANSEEVVQDSHLGWKTRGVLACLGVLHPALASSIAAAVMGQLWQPPELEIQKEKKKAHVLLNFCGFLLWCPSLFAWVKSGDIYRSWALSEAILGVPCVLFILKGVPRQGNLWYEGIIMSLWQLCFILALVFIVDGYSSTAVYLHSLSSLLSLVIYDSRLSGTHKRE